MGVKEEKKVLKQLVQDFDYYRHYIVKYDVNKLNESLDRLREDTTEYLSIKWFIGMINYCLFVEEYANNLSPKNMDSFNKIYPNIDKNRQYASDSERVAKRLGLSKNTINNKKLAIFKEIIEIKENMDPRTVN